MYIYDIVAILFAIINIPSFLLLFFYLAWKEYNSIKLVGTSMMAGYVFCAIVLALILSACWPLELAAIPFAIFGFLFYLFKQTNMADVVDKVMNKIFGAS